MSEIGMTRHVWGEHGVEYRIGEDGDGLGLVRLQHYEGGSAPARSEVCMTPDDAEAVAAQLVEMARFIRQLEETRNGRWDRSSTRP